MCSVLWQGGIKVAGGVRVANQLTLSWEMILGYPGGPTVITGVLIHEKRRQEESGNVLGWRYRYRLGGERVPGAKEYGQPRIWKRQGKGFSPGASRRSTALLTL